MTERLYLYDTTLRDDEDPLEVLESGGTPSLSELKLHNGTVYRWNRPIYDPGKGHPHVRVENRVLPAGPTIIDVLANAAFYFGVLPVLGHATWHLYRAAVPRDI